MLGKFDLIDVVYVMNYVYSLVIVVFVFWFLGFIYNVF